jgi:hypothetical protein
MACFAAAAALVLALICQRIGRIGASLHFFHGGD